MMVQGDRTDRPRADGGGAVGRVHLYPGSVHLDPVGPPPRAEARMAARCGGGRGCAGVRSTGEARRFLWPPLYLGFLRARLAPYSLRNPALKSFDRLRQQAVRLRPPSSGGLLLHRYAFEPKYRGRRLSGRLLQTPLLLYTCEHPGKGTLNATRGGLHKRSRPEG